MKRQGRKRNTKRVCYMEYHEKNGNIRYFTMINAKFVETDQQGNFLFAKNINGTNNTINYAVNNGTNTNQIFDATRKPDQHSDEVEEEESSVDEELLNFLELSKKEYHEIKNHPEGFYYDYLTLEEQLPP